MNHLLLAVGITIGIIGDQTYSTDMQASYAVLQKGVAELSRRHVDVVLHTGDLVESSKSPDEVRALFAQGAGILDRLPVRWYMAAGDHDVDPPDFQQDSPDRSREQLFQQLYGARVPAVLDHPYYSFDARGYHFIALDSAEVLDAEPRFGNIFLARIGDDQFAFLKRDLEEHRSARAVVVFLHQPLWYHASGWQRVHELLRRYRVAAVISGHTHYNQDSGTLDGIRYLTVGATGAVTKHGSRAAGDVQHVTILKLSGSKVREVRLIPLDDDLPLPLTPRIDMDRVQALDVQLGNLYDFASRNPVFLKDGQLVESCTSGLPATLKIAPIGNPIDLPLDVKLTFTSEPPGAVTLRSPAMESILPRTARTLFSNYSSVSINETPPLWTAGLAGTPQPGTVLKLRVRTTFRGASGELFLEKDVATTVQACPVK